MSFSALPLQILTRITAGHMTMIVRGELDLETAPQLLHALTDRLAHGPATALQLDLSGVPFMDSAGLHALLVAQRTAALIDGELVLTAASPQVARLLEVVGVSFPHVPHAGAQTA